MMETTRLYTFLLYASLSFCAGGVLYRVFEWFHGRVTERKAGSASTIGRMVHGIWAVARTFPGRGFTGFLRQSADKVLLQVHILKEDPLRWVMHIFLCYGFLYLLLFHALDDFITRELFPGYEPTLNPFRFLRNLFGLILGCGIGIAVFRRMTLKSLREINNKGDWAVLAILSLIVLSGFFLESARMISPRAFDEMVEEHAWGDPAETAGLQAYWSREFGVVFSEMINGPDTDHILDKNDPARFALGRSVHGESCAYCHDRPDSAIVSWPLSRMLYPAAGLLNAARADRIFWYVHFIACFTGLALLPFTKFFHILSAPVNLLVAEGKSGTERRKADFSERETERILGMDACTHCGVCARHCSVEPAYRILDNPDILPSEKLRSLRWFAKKGASPVQPTPRMLRLAEGSFACTACGRCSDLCPSGIDLQDLWTASQADLIRKGFPDNHGRARTHTASEWSSLLKKPDTAESPGPGRLGLTDRAETFWSCVQCTTCTTVCPVVGASDDPESELDLTPQQIMNLMRLQMKELALGARMVWNCVTCYQCQEHCPQGVRVADVLYELRNIAGERMAGERIKDHLRRTGRDRRP